MSIRAIRGATTCSDNAEDINGAVTELLSEIIKENGINVNEVISILFTATEDITSAYPAPAARAMGITRAGIMCMQEQRVTGSLSHCIRALVHVESDTPQDTLKHVYLRGAVALRPDLNENGQQESGGGKFFSVAIDGPGGAGKSTVAKLLARELGFVYVDTGAMYRAVALGCINAGADTADGKAVSSVLPSLCVELKYVRGEQRVFLNGEDVTKRIRSQLIADGSSKAAQFDDVRAEMTKMQRKIASRNNVVMDGRDIGTCVLPNADVKIYMDAAPRIRAERRVRELEGKGIACDIDTIEKEIKERDERDKNRAIAPLKMHEDAVYLDTGNMTAKEAAGMIKEIVEKCFTLSQGSLSR